MDVATLGEVTNETLDDLGAIGVLSLTLGEEPGSGLVEQLKEQQTHVRAIRAWVGETPREQLAWVLDGVVHGRDVAELTYPARAGLWASLAHLIESVTEGRWRIGRPDPEPIEQYTSRDADRAPWGRLPPQVPGAASS